LQHRRALALDQAREQHYPPVWKFQRIVMSVFFVLVDLPKDRSGVFDDWGLPRKQPVWAALYRSCKRKFSSGKNANRRSCVIEGSKADCAGIEEPGSQLLTDFGWA
jgi:hypothetical protein